MNKKVKNKLANNIKKLRKEKRISQESLSLELDFDVSYIGKVENEKMNISIDRIIKIADFFEVNFEDLFK
ncbi:MAG TPA: helix-turn-helix transcriptional regulator [Candidatus Gastranaerophilaceae bacterium]|nr:helix-turn-helix transcriptional regulator [Candidatus Gastranaerophilaceae bacterium]HPT41138.1 helix-turn-helix transcriptional regulator [Candidatus Gastranaerophilaceae bacterium]